MPIVRVEMWKSVSKEQKAQLAKVITEALETIAKKPRQYTEVVFSDYDKEDWAIGGELASDIDWSKRR